jgi:hypothetical protein
MRKTLALAVLLSGCVVHERYAVPANPPPSAPPSSSPPSSSPPAAPPPTAPPQNPPPPPAKPSQAQPLPQRLLEERDAVRIAAQYARTRGLEVERFKAKLDPQQRWRVEVRGEKSGDRARVLVDGFTGRVLRAKLSQLGDWEDLEG